MNAAELLRLILARYDGQDGRPDRMRGHYVRTDPILKGTTGHDYYVTSGYSGEELREIRKTHR